jgi:hypothetical protein
LTLELTRAAHSALEDKAGVMGKILATQKTTSPNYHADAVIGFQAGGRQYQYIAECKSAVIIVAVGKSLHDFGD